MQGRVMFNLGERKYVDIRVMGCNGASIIVENARYVLANGDEIETSGDCLIERESDSSVLLSALIQPQIPGGVYLLEFTYEVPPEILKYNVRVNVI